MRTMRSRIQFREGPDKPWQSQTISDFSQWMSLVRAWGEANVRTEDGEHWYDVPSGSYPVDSRDNPDYLMTTAELDQAHPVLAPFRLVPWPEAGPGLKVVNCEPPPKTRTVDLSDWRTWRNDAPGHCACGIVRSQCEYHR